MSTDHTGSSSVFSSHLRRMVGGARLIVDTRNSIPPSASHVYKLGAPHPAGEDVAVG